MSEAQIGTTISRCPACGQRLGGTASAECPLCGFHFADDRATGVDVTPYAECYADGERGWRRMCLWIWFAGQGRLKHLAMMRASAASRRFFWLNVFLLTAVAAVFQATKQGWHWVGLSTALHPLRRPSGDGWLHVSALPPNKLSGLASNDPVDLWWNPVHSVIAAVGGFLAGLVLLRLSQAMLSRILRSAHKPSFREEQRMSAALHYSTAWVLIVAAGVMLTWLRPLSYVGAMDGWIWYPPLHSLNLVAAIVVAIGIALWCFWLLRIAWTSPVSTRARVTFSTAFGAPVVIGLAAAAWWYGLDMAYRKMFEYLGIAF